MAETINTIEHDIAELERQLESRKAALEHEKSGSGVDNSPQEKEILREVVGEKIKEHAPSFSPPLPNSQQSSTITTEPPSYLTQEIKEKIQAIVDLIFSKNLEEGIKEAVKSGNPALIDAFHDILTDELYNQLIERRKLNKVD